VIADTNRSWINTTGNSRMASGGMGDLLTGLIAALWGQMEAASGLEAAALGAFLHGAAGDLAAKKRGGLSVTASQVAEFIPAAIHNLRRSS
jgi:NAD(P)H-hydrate epimerase